MPRRDQRWTVLLLLSPPSFASLVHGYICTLVIYHVVIKNPGPQRLHQQGVPSPPQSRKGPEFPRGTDKCRSENVSSGILDSKPTTKRVFKGPLLRSKGTAVGGATRGRPHGQFGSRRRGPLRTLPAVAVRPLWESQVPRWTNRLPDTPLRKGRRRGCVGLLTNATGPRNTSEWLRSRVWDAFGTTHRHRRREVGPLTATR